MSSKKKLMCRNCMGLGHYHILHKSGEEEVKDCEVCNTTGWVKRKNE